MNGGDLADLTVMIVDDQKEMRFIIKSVLEEMGIKNILESEDAKHAHHIVQYAFRKVDVILCDWNLPGLSGLDFLHQLKDEGRNIPFFVISGRGDCESVALAKNEAVAGYILKPFSPEQLEAHICAALHRIKHESL